VGNGGEEGNCNAHSQFITEEYQKLIQFCLDIITVCSEWDWTAASAVGYLLYHSLIAAADFVAAGTMTSSEGTQQVE